MNAIHETNVGRIAAGELYTAAEAKRRLGLGDWAWRKLRRLGLSVIYVSGRAYVLGDDLIEFFRARGSGRQAVPTYERGAA
ncbi:MAG: hypothetical protein QM775_09480 [Pirellulales bacterium]